ncbi:NAD(P)-dependent oxidoreductase [Nitrospira sp.]|nr:NAD(P)-dependent oxidoreductase [Nitrospira sp.]
MRIFVTGANGQVGREIARVVPRERLYLATHGSDDVSDDRIVKTIQRERPDVVIHAAALTDVDACEREPERANRINDLGTRLVATGAAHAGAYLIALSTDYVFDGTKGAPYVESDVPAPISVYGATKLAGERAALLESNHACVVRTAWVFGEGRRHFITMVMERIRQGEIVRGVVDRLGSPTYTRDLVAVLLKLAELKPTGVLHVAGAGACNWYQYAEAIYDMVDGARRLEPIAFAELERPARRPANSALASERLAGLGISMRSWREMVQDYLGTHEHVGQRSVTT